MLTGLEDDPRASLKPEHEFYPLAFGLWRRQDGLDQAEHAEAWRHGLAWWPRRGRPPVVDALSAAAAHLDRHGLSLTEIAATLGVDPDTLRPRQPSRHRDRPSIVRGRELLDAEPFGVRLRRELGTYRDERPPLPRVYALGEDEPEYTYFNPWVRPVEESLWRCRPDAHEFAERAQRELERRWEAERRSAPG